MLQALATAGIMGFLLIAFAEHGGVRRRRPTARSSPVWPASTTDILGETWGKVFLVDVALAIFVCALAIQAMSVRILFSMSRDNNLPFARQLASVHGVASRAGRAGRRVGSSSPC